jgi:cullin-associated NEDD8-dissociated protein 1
MKIDTLSFVQHLLQNLASMPQVFHPHAPILVPAIIAAVSDPFYKISSEALLVLESLVKVLRPLNQSSQFDFKPYTANVYQCCFVRLKASDIDQEVKERAISCMGQIIAHLGDQLKPELPVSLPIFLDRLKNEITRLTAVKALINIAKSDLKIDLKPILAEALPILAGFLRKNQRALKMSSLALLDTLVKNYSKQITEKNLEPVLVELQPLLSDADLHIAQLTMNLLTSVAKLHKGSLPMVQKTSLPQIFHLSQSPLLQGAALNAMLEFFQALVAAKLPGAGQKDLLKMLVDPVLSVAGSTIHKQGKASIAKCVAALVVTQNVQEAQAVVSQFASHLKPNDPSTAHQQTFSLLVIGEIGKHM